MSYRTMDAANLQAPSPWWEELAKSAVETLVPTPQPAARPAMDLFATTESVIRRLEPECPVCARRIERIMVTRDAMTPDVLITAWCHGMREQRVVSRMRLVADKHAFIDHLAKTWFNAAEFDPHWKGWTP